MTQELYVAMTIYKDSEREDKFVPDNCHSMSFRKVEGQAPYFDIAGDRELLIRRLKMVLGVLES